MSDERVFLNYRRADSAAQAARLRAELEHALGTGRVFRDTDSTEGGSDFPAELRHALERSMVVVALIGGAWLTELLARQAGAGGTDYVAHELVLARKLGVPILPVLVDGAKMPAERDLPGDLRFMARLHALPWGTGAGPDGLPAILATVRRHARLRGRPAESGGTTSNAARSVKGLLEYALRPRRFLLRYCRGEPFDFLVLAVVILLVNLPASLLLSAALMNNPIREAPLMAVGILVSVSIQTVAFLLLAIVVHVILRALGGRGWLSRGLPAVTYILAFVAAGFSTLIAAGFMLGVMLDPQIQTWKMLLDQAPSIADVATRFGEFPFYLSETTGTIGKAIFFASAAVLLVWVAFAWRAVAAIHAIAGLRSWLGLGIASATIMVLWWL